MSSVEVSPAFWARMQPPALARNGQLVGAFVENTMRSAMNQVLAFRGKELFAYAAPVSGIPSGDTASRVRWRFAGHTSKSCARLHIHVLMARNNLVDANDSTCSFTEEGSAQTVEWHFGGTSATDTPDEWAEFHGVMDITADTDVYGLFQEEKGGRLIAAVVYEEGKVPDTLNGYLSPTSAGANIYDEDRRLLVERMIESWTTQGAHVWNFTADLTSSAPQNSTTTWKNLLDTGVTTVSAASPGATLDMTGKATLRQEPTGVACIMKAYATTTGSTGKVRLVNSAGVAIATVNLTAPTASGWYLTTFYLPASAGKYDLQFALDAGLLNTVTVHAVSIYEVGQGTPSSFGITRVTYVATGAEGTGFNVPIGAVLGTASYAVLWTTTVGNVPIMGAPNAAGNRTTSQFRVETAAQMAAGETLEFVLIYPGGTATMTRVTYVATGAEGTDINVPIGAVLPTAVYAVLWTSTVGNVPILGAPNAGGDRTTSQFRVQTADQMAAGDTIEFTLVY